jgi:hypothetical protein
MSDLTAGINDWISSDITSIRLDFGSTDSDIFEIDWITIGAMDPAAYSATIQAQATSINGLEAKYTVKIDNNGAVAGYGLASAPNDAGQIVSEFIVNADRFAILGGATDEGTPTVPFTVYTTAQTHNGVTAQPGVYMSDAFIANGTITTAKIGLAAIDNAQIADAAITNAKINDLNASKITAGFISAARIQAGTIDADKIAANAITADKINADAVTADKIGANAVGAQALAISASTDSVANSIFMDSSGAIKVYDASGNLRVKIGNLSA